jgi:cellulose biosynthesis protein BcsQ
MTFYSYKGGTGRSMMLANVAWLLATNGERVLVIDWDLEAPGLHRYFRPFLVDPDLTETDGLIDALWTLTTRALTTKPSGENSFSFEKVGFNGSGIDLEDYITPLTWDFHGSGAIDFIGAGRQAGTYSERVNTFDWKRFYGLGGATLLERTKKHLREEYTFILIDSRTGVSDTSGICTMQMPDMVVACLTLNRQSIEGVASVLNSIRSWESSVNRADNTQIRFFPVATRIENSEKEKLDVARARVREVFRPFLAEQDVSDTRRYWDDMEVTYRPFYAYEEILAAFGDTAGAAGSARTLLSEMENIGRRVADRSDLAMPEIPERDRQRVLAQYALGTVVTPVKPVQAEEIGPEPDADILRDIYAKEVLWRKSGFRYRHLLSRRELQLITAEDRQQFGRQMGFFYSNSEIFYSFQEKINRNFVFNVVFASIILVVYLVAQQLRVHYYDLDGSVAPLFRIISYNVPILVVIILELLVLVQFFLAFRSRYKPYGITIFDVLKLSILGPLSSEIQDFRDEDRQA